MINCFHLPNPLELNAQSDETGKTDFSEGIGRENCLEYCNRTKRAKVKVSDKRDIPIWILSVVSTYRKKYRNLFYINQ